MNTTRLYLILALPQTPTQSTNAEGYSRSPRPPCASTTESNNLRSLMVNKKFIDRDRRQCKGRKNTFKYILIPHGTWTPTLRTCTIPGEVARIVMIYDYSIYIPIHPISTIISARQRWTTHSTEKMHRHSWKVWILLLLRNRRCSLGRASNSVTWPMMSTSNAIGVIYMRNSVCAWHSKNP